MTVQERAFLIASVNIAVEKEKEYVKELEREVR